MNLPFGAINTIMEIEISAEKLYYSVIGKKKEMEDMMNTITSSKNKDKIYFISKLLIPLANVAELQMQERKIDIVLAENIEHVQCSLLCDCKGREDKQMYTLLCLEKEKENTYILKFPEIELKENIEPEQSIIRDINKIMITIPKPIKDTLRLIDITGLDEDILVYSARISYPKNAKVINKLKYFTKSAIF